MPGHHESKPSFMVFTNSDYENYYCFGCGSGTTIIQLISDMDGISRKESISILSDGMEITEELDTEYIYGRYGKQISSEFSENPGYPSEIASLSLLSYVSEFCRTYLEGVDNNEAECEVVDKFWKVVDRWIADYEFDEIHDIATCIPMLLAKRREKFEREKMDKLRKEYASK